VPANPDSRPACEVGVCSHPSSAWRALAGASRYRVLVRLTADQVQQVARAVQGGQIGRVLLAAQRGEGLCVAAAGAAYLLELPVDRPVVCFGAPHGDCPETCPSRHSDSLKGLVCSIPDWCGATACPLAGEPG